MKVEYTLGSWFVVVGPGAVVALHPTAAAHLTAQSWRELSVTGDTFATVLKELASSYGMDFSTLPPFVVISQEPDAWRVVVRGDLTVAVTHSHGEVAEVTGSGATTWAEKSFTELECAELVVETASGPPLPLDAGVAGFSTVRVAPAQLPSAPLPSPQPASPAADMEAPVSAATLLPDQEEPPAPAPASHYDDMLTGDTRGGSTDEAAVRNADDANLISAVPGVVKQPTTPASAAGKPSIQGPGPRVPFPPPFPAPSTPPGAKPGDHDGQTMSLEQLAQLRKQLGTQFVPPPVGPAKAPPTMHVSTGESVSLDRSTVVGRRPQAVRASGTVPQLVTVPSPAQDVSRSHVEFRMEGSDLVAVDLDTTNGTWLNRPGKDPVRLHPGEPTLVVAGDTFDIGDGVLISFEGLS